MGRKLQKAKYHFFAFIKKLIYKLIFGKRLQTESGVTFRKGFSLCVEDGASVKIGKDCFFNNYCSLNILSGLEIGKRCIFGENVKIYDHNHIYKDTTVPIKEQGFSKAPVKIGNDCWIGSNVTILKGVTVGNRCVIGAGCLIYKDVPDNTVVKNKTELVFEPIE